MTMIIKLIGLTSFILVIAVACFAQNKEQTKSEDNSPNAKEIVLTAFSKQAETKGYHFEGKEYHEGPIGGLKDYGKPIKQSATVTGIRQNPDCGMMRRNNAYGRTTEIYQKGNRMTIKSQDNKWSAPYNSNISPFPFSSFDILAMCKQIENAKVTGNERLNETNCSIIEASISIQELKRLLPDRLDDPIIIDSKFTVASFKVWIGSENKLPCKLFIAYSKETELFTPPKEEPGDEGYQLRGPKIKVYNTATYEMTFFDYDKDVEIKLPDEVKKVLGIE